MRIAVVGAHLSGLPLNGQLIERNAKLVKTVRTKPIYRFYASPAPCRPSPACYA